MNYDLLVYCYKYNKWNIVVLQLDLRQDKPYLETTASKLVENTKAFEWTIIKELGKLTTVTSG